MWNVGLTHLPISLFTVIWTPDIPAGAALWGVSTYRHPHVRTSLGRGLNEFRLGPSFCGKHANVWSFFFWWGCRREVVRGCKSLGSVPPET